MKKKADNEEIWIPNRSKGSKNREVHSISFEAKKNASEEAFSQFSTLWSQELEAVHNGGSDSAERISSCTVFVEESSIVISRVLSVLKKNHGILINFSTSS
jgi:hypothetical protein